MNAAGADVCVLFALGRETMFFRRGKPRRQISDAPCRAWWAGPVDHRVLVVEHGLGTEAVETALHWLLDGPVRPQRVLGAGFCGSLHPALAVGDLVFASEVLDTAGGCWATAWAELVEGSWHHGRLVTSPGLVGRPDDKRRLREEYDALAVDMESAAIARACSRHRVPFGCLRAVSDDSVTALSNALVAVLKRGRPSPARLALALCRHPWMLGELARLARHTRTAARRLSGAIESLLPRLTAAHGPPNLPAMRRALS